MDKRDEKGNRESYPIPFESIIYFLLTKRIISPIQRTNEVAITMMIQSIGLTPPSATLNISWTPGISVIMTWPMKITRTMIINHFVFFHEIPLNAESEVMNDLALNRFQNCSITKMVKKKIVIQPNVGAAIFLLTNLDPEHYQNSQKSDITLKPSGEKEMTIDEINKEIERLSKLETKE